MSNRTIQILILVVTALTLVVAVIVGLIDSLNIPPETTVSTAREVAPWAVAVLALLVLALVGPRAVASVKGKLDSAAERQAVEQAEMLLQNAVPLAWVPGSPCQGKIDPDLTVEWPEKVHHERYERVELVFMYAPPWMDHDTFERHRVEVPSSDESAPFMRFGIEVQSSGRSLPDIVVYVSSDGRAILYEWDKPVDEVGVAAAVGQWIAMVLEKSNDQYTVTVNGKPIWTARQRKRNSGAGDDVELWRENVCIRTRLFANDPTARVIVRDFKPE